METDLNHIETRGYSRVYFSPHLDDAVFSCGGRILAEVEAGENVLVVTVFSGARSGDSTSSAKQDDPFAAFGDMESRRQEDARALAALGADHLWLGHEEAIQRDRRYRSLPGLLSRVAPSDLPLVEEIRSTVGRLRGACPRARFYFPLGAGNHVDHQMLCSIGLEEDSLYYEEVPYSFIPYLLEHRLRGIAAYPPPDLSVAPDMSVSAGFCRLVRETVAAIMEIRIISDSIKPYQRPLLHLFVASSILSRRAPIGKSRPTRQRRLRPESIDLSPQLRQKLKAVEEYSSQVAALSGDIETFRRWMIDYSHRATGGEDGVIERIWVDEGEPPATDRRQARD